MKIDNPCACDFFLPNWALNLRRGISFAKMLQAHRKSMQHLMFPSIQNLTLHSSGGKVTAGFADEASQPDRQDRRGSCRMTRW